MSQSGEHERMQANFDRLRVDEARLAPSFQATWAAAEHRLDAPRLGARLRFAVVAALVCATTATLAMLAVTHNGREAVAPAAPAVSASEELSVPVSPVQPIPIDTPTAVSEEKCAVCPPSTPAVLDDEREPRRQPKAVKPVRKRTPSASDPCAEC